MSDMANTGTPNIGAGAADPLAQLHPLHYPQPFPWWQLAWGWWAVIGSVVVLIVVLGIVFWRKHRRTLHNRYREEGVLLLNYCWEQHGSSAPITYLHELNSILKRVALVSYGDSAVFNGTTIPALHGKDWVAFLDSTVKAPLFAADYTSYLTDDLYRDTVATDVSLAALHETALQWINTHHAQFRPRYV